MRERQRKEERLKREQKREIERRENFSFYSLIQAYMSCANLPTMEIKMTFTSNHHKLNSFEKVW